MKKTLMDALLVALFTLSACTTRQVDIRPLPFTHVKVEDTFWRQRLDTMQRHTIRYAFSKVEAAGQIRNTWPYDNNNSNNKYQ